MRWVLCWYGIAAVNRADAGSIPATAAFTLQPSLFILPHVSLAERQRFRTSNPVRWVRLPQDTLPRNVLHDVTRASAKGKPAAFEAVVCRFDSFRPCC